MMVMDTRVQRAREAARSLAAGLHRQGDNDEDRCMRGAIRGDADGD